MITTACEQMKLADAPGTSQSLKVKMPFYLVTLEPYWLVLTSPGVSLYHLII